jgi:hypothetical protein
MSEKSSKEAEAEARCCLGKAFRGAFPAVTLLFLARAILATFAISRELSSAFICSPESMAQAWAFPRP